MKKVLLFLILPFFLLIQSCSFTDFKVENDLTKENLKGDVILVYSNLKYGGISLKAYNDNGMLIQHFSGEQTKYFSSAETVYDNDRILKINYRSSFGRDVLQSEDNRIYDLEGKLISVSSGGYSTKYNYDDEGRLISEIGKGSNESSHVKEFYYSNGKLDSTSLLMKLAEDGGFSTNVFDENFEIIKRFQVKVGGSRILTSISNNKKNESGDIIEEVSTEFDSKGNKTKITTIKYEYSYDEKGNWTQKRIIESGVLKETEYRTIVYKGGDTKIFLDEMESIIRSFGRVNKSNNSTQNDVETESNVPAPSRNNYETQSSQNTQSQQQTCRECKGTGGCRECSRMFKVQYWDNGWRNRNETRPGQIMCNTCYGAGVKYGRVSSGGGDPETEKCHVSSCKDGWLPCRECNNYGNGKNIGKCGECKGMGYRN